MRKDLIPTMEEFNSMSRSEQIETLCTVHECNKKIRTIHRDQYVKRDWNPHPPARFMQWWAREETPEMIESRTGQGWEGIDAVRAFNCERVRVIYREHKEFGLI